MKGWLLRRRNQPLDEAQRRALELTLQQVRSIGLPL
jgi:hypothetical protein